MRTLMAALVILMGLQQSAFAQMVKVGVRGDRLPAAKLATFESLPGESEEAFLLRRSVFFQGVATSTGFEACAQVCSAPDGRTGFVAYTNFSHLACMVVNQCPDGMQATDRSIHVHPRGGAFQLNDADRVFLQARNSSGRIQRSTHGRIDQRPRFSREDYRAGPGYLVSGDELLFQSGRGTARVVGTIKPLQAE